MQYDVHICRLSKEFYNDYPATEYPEILTKANRPYTCLVLQRQNGCFICIPFRSSIKHDSAFLFTGTKRSEKTRSGLDYKKTIIINNKDYIESEGTAVVDSDEYAEVAKNIKIITAEIEQYITAYINHINGTVALHPREFARKYKFSTLPYFHNLLKLPE